jgi:hypothetical protein
MNEWDQLVRDEQYHIRIRRTMEMFLTSVEEEAAGTKPVTMARVIQLWKAATKETIAALAKSPNLWLNDLSIPALVINALLVGALPKTLWYLLSDAVISKDNASTEWFADRDFKQVHKDLVKNYLHEYHGVDTDDKEENINCELTRPIPKHDYLWVGQTVFYCDVNCKLWCCKITEGWKCTPWEAVVWVKTAYKLGSYGYQLYGLWNQQCLYRNHRDYDRYHYGGANVRRRGKLAQQCGHDPLGYLFVLQHRRQESRTFIPIIEKTSPHFSQVSFLTSTFSCSALQAKVCNPVRPLQQYKRRGPPRSCILSHLNFSFSSLRPLAKKITWAYMHS